MHRKGEYLKSGWYGIYKGNEYELTRDMAHNRIIMTKDKSAADETFEYNSVSGIYKKVIDNSEIEYAYALDVYALVDGEEIGVMKETEDEYLVSTDRSDKDIIEKYGLIEVDRNVFQGWVSKEFVQLIEEKKELQYDPKKKKLVFKE